MRTGLAWLWQLRYILEGEEHGTKVVAYTIQGAMAVYLAMYPEEEYPNRDLCEVVRLTDKGLVIMEIPE